MVSVFALHLLFALHLHTTNSILPSIRSSSSFSAEVCLSLDGKVWIKVEDRKNNWWVSYRERDGHNVCGHIVGEKKNGWIRYHPLRHFVPMNTRLRHPGLPPSQNRSFVTPALICSWLLSPPSYHLTLFFRVPPNTLSQISCLSSPKASCL